jgi:phenylpropionate dioxygenase-like ring-hydroxylating dioxygenase large terminal subunit
MALESARDRLMPLARRALAHLEAGTTDLAPSTLEMPLSAYADPQRYERELAQIWRRVPLALALSAELPAPGAYKALPVAGVPVLLVRGGDGGVRAFVNACRHRGAPLREPGCGRATRFTCPYHAWSYDERGALVGMFGDRTFGDVDRAALALRALPCAERAGFVWASLTPGAPLDVDAWLGDFAEQLDTLSLGSWHVHLQRELPGPGWKVAWDGYLEGYHQAALHPQTVGKNTLANLMVVDSCGPHQRIVFGRKTLGQLSDTPETEWDPAQHIRLIHSVFPNLSISGILGDHCLVSQLFPGDAPNRSVTVQTILTERVPETPEQKQAAEAFAALTLRAVRDEDYRMCSAIQRGIDGGALAPFVFGRNEPTLQHYHRWVERLGRDSALEEGW